MKIYVNSKTIVILSLFFENLVFFSFKWTHILACVLYLAFLVKISNEYQQHII